MIVTVMRCDFEDWQLSEEARRRIAAIVEADLNGEIASTGKLQEETSQGLPGSES